MTTGGSFGAGGDKVTGGGAGTGGAAATGGGAGTGGAAPTGGGAGAGASSGSGGVADGSSGVGTAGGGTPSFAGSGGVGTAGDGGTTGGTPSNAGGMSGAGNGGMGGGNAGTAAGVAGSAGAAMSGRPQGACQPGSSYPAPVLTGTPRLVSMAMDMTSGTYEGPVWQSAKGKLLFSDITSVSPIPPSQLQELTLPSTVAPFLADSGTNGLALDRAGAIYGCSHKVQGIVKLDGNTLTTVVSTIDGKRFNSPNDVVIRSDGIGYFTDPDYQLGDRTSETGKKGVYRFSPGGAASVVDDTFDEPNGITLSPDETVLYVADYPANVVRKFAVAADGSASGRVDFATVMSPDGFAVDCVGNLYVASGTPQDMPTTGGTVEVFSPAGGKLGSVTVAPFASNLAFGGPDGKTLYVTAGRALYALDMNVPGYFY
jgi:gluconolactonase